MESITKSTRNCETWLSNYKGNTLKKYKMAWDYWTDYLGTKDETWIFANKDIEDWPKHLVNFHRWLKTQSKKRGRGKLSDNTSRLIVSSLRAYLKHCGIAVSFSRVQQMEISKVESMPFIDYPLNLKTKEELLKVANPEEEYIISAGISFGLRIGDFQEIRRGQLEPLLDQEPPVQMPKLMTKKVGVPAYPYIDRDAKEAIVRLLKELDAQGKTKNNSRMLPLTQRQINETLKNLFKKANIATGEYVVRFHILRKFLTDNLAKICSSDKWKHFVGKSAQSPYVGSEGRESYAKVMPFTNVNGKRVKVNNQELEDLKHALKHVEGEYRIAETRIQELSGHMEAQKTALEDTKQVVNVLLKTVESLSEKLGKAKRKS